MDENITLVVSIFNKISSTYADCSRTDNASPRILHILSIIVRHFSRLGILSLNVSSCAQCRRSHQAMYIFFSNRSVPVRCKRTPHFHMNPFYHHMGAIHFWVGSKPQGYEVWHFTVHMLLFLDKRRKIVLGRHRWAILHYPWYTAWARLLFTMLAMLSVGFPFVSD